MRTNIQELLNEIYDGLSKEQQVALYEELVIRKDPEIMKLFDQKLMNNSHRELSKEELFALLEMADYREASKLEIDNYIDSLENKYK